MYLMFRNPILIFSILLCLSSCSLCGYTIFSSKIQPRKVENKIFLWSCDSSKTKGFTLIFNKGFKNDSVSLYNNDSLVFFERITTKESTGVAASFRIPILPSQLVLKVNSKRYGIVLNEEYCFISFSQKLGILNVKMSKTLVGPHW